MRAALALAGVGAERMVQLGVPDLAASEDLPRLVYRLTLLLRGLKPGVIVTHGYEGGHPDHDAAAFAAQAVVERLSREEGWSPPLVEMLSYHQEGDELVADRFLAAPTDRFAVTLRLTPREREVVNLIARGYRYKETAQRLNITIKTLESHMRRIFDKLQVASRHELTRLAFEQGYVPKLD